MNVQLTMRDLEILHALTHCVRVLSVDQIRRGWWSSTTEDSTAVRDRLRLLARSGWISRASILTQPLPKMDEPLAVWWPGQVSPPFDAIAWTTKKRWRAPARSTPVVLASDKAARRFFGRQARGLRQAFQATHDLGLSEVYLHFRKARTSLLPLWRGERQIASLRRRRKVPDAVIADASLWPPQVVIEFAGMYSAERMRNFHSFCVRESLPYELW